MSSGKASDPTAEFGHKASFAIAGVRPFERQFRSNTGRQCLSVACQRLVNVSLDHLLRRVLKLAALHGSYVVSMLPLLRVRLAMRPYARVQPCVEWLHGGAQGFRDLTPECTDLRRNHA